MDLKKYISKHLVMRLCLLLTLVGSAALFDVYHSDSQKLTGKTPKAPASNEAEANKVFFCNQVPSYNLKTSGTDITIRLRFSCSQDKFLLKYYNLRTFQLMKAETLHASCPRICSFRALPFNRVLYSSPDDIPPLS